jgi:hypothetical protein
MSKRFNPVSTAIAVATASVLVAIGGCAATRSDDNAALSHEPNRNPESMAEPGAPQDALNPSAMTAPAEPTTVAMAEPAPAAEVATPIQQPLQQDTVIAQGDTSATPAVPPQTAPTYTEAPMSTAGTSSTTATNQAPLSSDSETLPPRADRN